MQNNSNPHAGSSFDDFLAEEGILEEVTEVATKRVLAYKLGRAMKMKNLTKTALARRMNTSRNQLNRLLDAEDVGVTLKSIVSAAKATGMRVRISFENDEKEIA